MRAWSARAGWGLNLERRRVFKPAVASMARSWLTSVEFDSPARSGFCGAECKYQAAHWESPEACPRLAPAALRPRPLPPPLPESPATCVSLGLKCFKVQLFSVFFSHIRLQRYNRINMVDGSAHENKRLQLATRCEWGWSQKSSISHFRHKTLQKHKMGGEKV